MPRQAAPVTSARDIFLNIDVLCTVSSWRAPLRARPQITKNQNRIGLVNRKVFFDSPRRQLGAVFSAAFIFNEGRLSMVNRLSMVGSARFMRVPSVNPMLNRIRVEPDE